MIRPIFVSIILAYSCLASSAFAENMEKIFPESFRFQAKVAYQDEFPEFWIQIFEEKEFKKILSKTNGSNYKKQFQAYRVSIYGLKSETYTDTYSQLRDYHDNFIKSVVIDQVFDFNCIGVNKKRQMVCEMFLGEQNVAKSMIKDGVSKFNIDKRLPESINGAYIDAENQAKENNLGVWQSFIGMFTFDKKP